MRIWKKAELTKTKKRKMFKIRTPKKAQIWHFWPKPSTANYSGDFMMQNELGNVFLARFWEKPQNRSKTLSKWTFEKLHNLDFFQYDREKPWFLIFSPENDFFEKDAQRHFEPFAPIFNWNGPFSTHFVTENRFCEFSCFFETQNIDVSCFCEIVNFQNHASKMRGEILSRLL